MWKDFLFAVSYILVAFWSAYVYDKIRTHVFPMYYYFIISAAFAIIGAVMLKYSDLSLIKQSAIITFVTRFGYLVGLVWIGEMVTPSQWFGIAIMTFGSILTNK